jgi:ABC-type multidrug transport system fused ATPase/permease subunit
MLTSQERRSALRLFGLMFLGMLIETFSIGLIIPAVALLTQSNLMQRHPDLIGWLAWMAPLTHEKIVVLGVFVIIGVYFAKNLYLGRVAWEQARFVFGIQANLSQRLFTLYMTQPYTFHLQRNSAELIRNIVGEVEIFTTNCVSPAMLLLAEALVLLGIAVLLFLFEPLGSAAVVVVTGAAGYSFYAFLRRPIARWGHARQYHAALRLQHVQQGLSGVKDVKVLGREEEFLHQYQIHNLAGAKLGKFQAMVQQVPRMWLEVLAVSSLGILVVVMLAQGRSMSAIVATLGLFGAAAFRLLPSVNRVLLSVQSLRYGLPAIDSLNKELLLGSTPENSERRRSIAEFLRGIEVDRISYYYPDTTNPALEEVSLSIPKGSSVGIIGESGSGKSTLIDIILGLHTPSSGRILLDGADIQENMRGWQDRIGYVPQSIYLTDDTLIRNVAFGISDEKIDVVAVARAIRSAQLGELVESLPQGLGTFVGERGVRLSGGQRQRIGIARALYHNPDVMILDEATSALDEETECEVMQAINKLRGSKTLIIIAHRFSSIRDCDMIYRLDRGRVRAWGTPEQMLIQDKQLKSSQ